MPSVRVINVAKEFGRYPAGRYTEDGPYSGQDFRERLLEPALRDPDVTNVVVQFDGARGLASSFLEEAFGGLVRAGFDAEFLLNHLELQSSDSSVASEIKGYIEDMGSVSRKP